MGFIGILYALPIQAGNGLTKVGNRIDLGGELTDVVNFHTNEESNTITINNQNYSKSFTFSVTGVGGIANDTTMSLDTVRKTLQITDIENDTGIDVGADFVSIVNNQSGNVSSLTSENLKTGNTLQSSTNAPFKVIDASSGIIVPDTLIKMEINGSTYQIPAKS